MNAKTRPVHEFRLGRVSATVWRKKVARLTRYHITFAVLCDDGWNDSPSFSQEDLPDLAQVADAAYAWLHENGQSQTAA
jgi:hypothetical protein